MDNTDQEGIKLIVKPIRRMTQERKEKIDETDETGEKEDVRKKGRYEMRLTRKEWKGKI